MRIVALTLALFCSVAVWATPYNSPTVDGVISVSPDDWDADELAGEDSVGDSPWAGNDLHRLWLTWDAENLYLGIEYSISNNAMIVYVETGESGGVSDFSSERGYGGAFPRNITFPDSVGVDLMVASWNGEGPYVYTLSADESADITGGCRVATGDSYEQEVSIPWSEIYPDETGIVRPGARLLIVAVIAGGDDWGAADALPDNPSVDGGEGPHNLTRYIEITVDSDGDGIPDFSGGALTGRVVFDDPLFAEPPYPRAEIQVFDSGGNLTGEATSSPEDGSFVVAGLDSGQVYRIVARARGFAPDTIDDFIFLGVDSITITLEPYTGTIFGSISPDSLEIAVFALADGETVGFGDTISPGEDTYSITHLPDGLCDVWAVPSSPEFSVFVAESVEVRQGDSVRLDIALERAGVLREVSDPVGDDYGPGWYLYPTDPVFVPGSFDITYVKIRDLAADGKYQFEIGVREIPDSSVVWWSPYYPPLNLQKIDIYIDCHGGGARVALPNRNATFAATDAWDFAISADGWWKGLLASNGQDIFSNFSQNVDAVEVITDTVGNRIFINVDKSALVDNLGMADTANFDQWDFMVLMLGHDGDGVEGVRWVNAGTGNQWQFNGGADGDIDPNIIDLVALPGVDADGNPKPPGKSQEEMLDYTVQSPVQLETHRSYDITPPEIEYQIPSRIVHLAGTKGVYIEVKIEDDVGVAEAYLYWRNVGGQWHTPIPLGFRERVNAFVGDIPAAEVNPDSFEFYFVARDFAGNETYCPRDYADTAEPAAPAYPFSTVSPVPDRVVPPIDEVDTVDIAVAANTFLDSVAEKFADGSILVIHRDDLAPGVDTVHIKYFASFPAADRAPDMVPLSGFRTLVLSGDDGGVPLQTAEFSFHYYEPADTPFPQGLEQNAVLAVVSPLGVWIPAGGKNSTTANCVDAEIAPADTLRMGVFALENVARTDEPIKAVIVQPNPFSPNGDGVCDIANISLETNYPGNVDMDLFSLDGEHIRTLAENMYVSAGRSENIIWDGRDDDGAVCPMGIYVLSVRFKYVFENNERWFRKNVAVVVVR